MLQNGERVNDITATAGIYRATVYRYKRNIEITGRVIDPARIPQNVRKLPMWAMEVGSFVLVPLFWFPYSGSLVIIANTLKGVMNLLVLKPILYFNEITNFLTEEYDIYVLRETVRRYLR